VGVRAVTRGRTAVARAVLYAFLILGLAFIVLPIAIVVVNSFNASPFGIWPPPGFSTRWYANLFQNAGFGPPTIKSLQVAVVATAGALLIGTLAGIGIARYRFLGRNLIQGFVAAPLIVPKVAIGFAAFILFLELDWYGDFHTVVLAHIVITLPFVVTLVVAGLARVDRTLEEAAMDLGAVPHQVLWRATLPQMRGALAAAAAFAFIISFDELDATIFIVGQTDNTLPVSMFIYMEKYQDPTLASLSALLIGAALVLGVGIAVLLARIGGIRALGAASEPGVGVVLEPSPAVPTKEDTSR
jgi:putative spermidine/putrescine transport system permease protein